MSYLGYTDQQAEAQLSKEGIEAPGVVVGGESTKRRRSSSHKLEIRWTPTGGSERTQTISVDKAFWQKVDDAGGMDTPVTVRYVAGKEAEARLKSGENFNTEMLAIGGVWFVLGILGGLWWLKRK
jgi:hypothetical protein